MNARSPDGAATAAAVEAGAAEAGPGRYEECGAGCANPRAISRTINAALVRVRSFLMSIIDSDLRLQSWLTDSDFIATHPRKTPGKARAVSPPEQHRRVQGKLYRPAFRRAIGSSHPHSKMAD